jgi:hypothetical protein
MLDRLHLGAARCAKVFHRFTGSVGFSVSHGRLPDASRSHGRATDPAFSSNTSLAREALIWSRIDISAAAVACSADRTIALDDRKRIAPTTKIFFINADSTITCCCPIYLRPQRGARNNDRLPRNAVDAVIVHRRLPRSLRKCARLNSGLWDPRAGRRTSNHLLPHLLSSITERGCARRIGR